MPWRGNHPGFILLLNARARFLLQKVPCRGYIINISASNVLHSTVLHGRYTRLPQPMSSVVLLPHIGTEEEGKGEDISFSPLASVVTAGVMLPMCLSHSRSAVRYHICAYKITFTHWEENPPKKPVLKTAIETGILSIQGRWGLLGISSEAPQTSRMLLAMTLLPWLYQSILASVICAFLPSALLSSITHSFLRVPLK